jgi:hypothetical protein
MRLGLGLGFLHRVAKTVVVAVVETFFLLQEDGDFLMLEEPIQLFTQSGDNLITQDGFSLVVIQSEDSGQIELEQ